MMDESVVEERTDDTTDLIASVPVQMVSEARVEVVSKPVVTMTPVTMTPVTVTTNGVSSELIAAQYINLHRVPEQLNKVLVSDALSGELLSHHVDLATAADFTQHGVATHYYDTDDLLSHDLTEEDRRLAAELVAVQLNHQQQRQQHHQQTQQNQILPTTLNAVQAVNMDRPAISAAIVTSYIQAVEEEVVHQHLLQQQQQQQQQHDNSDRCIMKIYQQTTAHDLQQVLTRQQTQPLPPLKKVLSSQSMVLRNKFQSTPAVMVELPNTPILSTTGVSDDGSGIKLEGIKKNNQTITVTSNLQPTTPAGQSGQVQGQTGLGTEDLDSDYDAESDTRPSRRSLPHKKRIPRKLKAPPTRSIHTKCYKCNKCGESFTSQTAFASHKLIHTAPAKQRPSSNNLVSAFSCELCSKQFLSQLKFFEHLKQHYEPNNCSVSNNNTNNINLNNVNLTMATVNSSNSNNLPELTPAPIVATCIAPLPGNQHHPSVQTHSIVSVSTSSQPTAQLHVSNHSQDVITMQPATPSNADTPPLPHPTITGAFSIKDELGQGVVKEEIVTSTGLACNQCGETFRKAKSLDNHIATVHPRQEEIEEFSEPEDMMEGISIRHVVNISNVMSGDEGDCCGEEDCGADVVDDKIKWRYQEVQDLGMDLQDIPCLPLPAASTLNHHHVAHHNSHHGSTTPNAIVPDNDTSHLDDDVDTSSPVNNHVRMTMNVNSNNSNNNNNSNNSSLSGPTPINISIPGMNNKKQLNCPECDRTFNHRNSLLYHIRSHSGSRPHQCEVCGKSFFSASALKVHMRLHSGDKPYKCEFCGKHFRQWGDLKYHVTSLHSEQKQFQCEYCGKDFARKYSLIVHRRIHTGEKNYKCDFCMKTFRASSYLQNHRRIHTGEKPHSCDICGKPFRVRSDMKRHRQTHSRERPASRSTTAATPNVNSDDQEDNSVDNAESILPDNAMTTPLNLNIRQGDSNDSLTYSRAASSLEREGNTLYVWIPAQHETNILANE